jgi:hypothetical protein
VADLVEPAKAAALDKLDEGQRALGIATGWLRARMASAGPATPTLSDHRASQAARPGQRDTQTIVTQASGPDQRAGPNQRNDCHLGSWQ